MTVTDQSKILDKKIMQKNPLKYLHCLLITWTNMNI